MPNTNLAKAIIDQVWIRAQLQFDGMKKAEYKDFRSYYENNYDEIKVVIKKYYLDKPYTKETFDEILIKRHDIIQKTLDRLTSGVYDKEPIRELVLKGDKEKKIDNNLSDVLSVLDYHNIVKESFRKGIYYNILGVNPVLREEEIVLDVLTPDMIWVTTGLNYFKARSVIIERSNDESLITYVYWDAEKHFHIDAVGNFGAPAKDNIDGTNPYEEIPVAWLRFKKGNDFYGEPEWDLLLDQISVDMGITDFDFASIMQRGGILWAHNANIPDGQRIRPNVIVKTSQQDPDKEVKLEYLKFNTDFSDWRESIEWRKKAALVNKGMSGSSVSSDPNEQSGRKALVDERPLEEKRISHKSILQRFEIDLLNRIRTVWNYHVGQGNVDGEKLNEEGKFTVKFIEEKPFETEEQKDKRINREIKLGIKDKLQIIMEELELDEEAAIEYLKEQVKRKQKLADAGIDVDIVLTSEQGNVRQSEARTNLINTLNGNK